LLAVIQSLLNQLEKIKGNLLKLEKSTDFYNNPELDG